MPLILRRTGWLRLALGVLLMAAPHFALAAPPALVEEHTQDTKTEAPTPARLAAARAVIEEVIVLSRAGDIYADARTTLTEVTLPILRETGEGAIVGALPPDAKTAERIAKLMTFLDYVRRACDELDGPIAESREAMVSEAAEMLARQLKDDEIADLSQLLMQPGTRKAFEVSYAFSKFATGFTLDETRTFAEFSAWASQLHLDLSSFGAITGGEMASPPPPPKIAKGQLIVEDFFKVARFEDSIAEVKRFMTEVVLPNARVSEEERADLRQKVDQFEFTYTFQKSVALAVGPAMLASSLTEEQLQVLHGFVRSAAFEKLFTLLRAPVSVAASLNAQEFNTTQAFLEEVEKKAKSRPHRYAEGDRFEADWKAYFDKWKNKLADKLSPEVRRGLKDSAAEIERM